MAIQILSLNTTFPPTWDGTPPDIPESLDAESAVRHPVGDDWVHYINFQRWCGDLFKRDLLNSDALRRLNDFMAARAGLTFNLPATRMLGDTFIKICDVNAATPGLYFVASSIAATDTSGLSLVIRDADNEVLMTRAAGDDFWAVASTADRGMQLGGTGRISVSVQNESGDVKTVTASVVVGPSLMAIM